MGDGQVKGRDPTADGVGGAAQASAEIAAREEAGAAGTQRPETESHSAEGVERDTSVRVVATSTSYRSDREVLHEEEGSSPFADACGALLTCARVPNSGEHARTLRFAEPEEVALQEDEAKLQRTPHIFTIVEDASDDEADGAPLLVGLWKHSIVLVLVEEESDSSDDEFDCYVGDGVEDASKDELELLQQIETPFDLHDCDSTVLLSLEWESDSESDSGADFIGSAFSADATTGLWADGDCDTIG